MDNIQKVQAITGAAATYVKSSPERLERYKDLCEKAWAVALMSHEFFDEEEKFAQGMDDIFKAEKPRLEKDFGHEGAVMIWNFTVFAVLVREFMVFKGLPVDEATDEVMKIVSKMEEDDG